MRGEDGGVVESAGAATCASTQAACVELHALRAPPSVAPIASTHTLGVNPAVPVAPRPWALHARREQRPPAGPPPELCPSGSRPPGCALHRPPTRPAPATRRCMPCTYSTSSSKNCAVLARSVCGTSWQAERGGGGGVVLRNILVDAGTNARCTAGDESAAHGRAGAAGRSWQWHNPHLLRTCRSASRRSLMRERRRASACGG